MLKCFGNRLVQSRRVSVFGTIACKPANCDIGTDWLGIVKTSIALIKDLCSKAHTYAEREYMQNVVRSRCCACFGVMELYETWLTWLKHVHLLFAIQIGDTDCSS